MEIRMGDKVKIEEFDCDRYLKGNGTSIKFTEGLVVSEPIIFYRVFLGKGRFKDVLASQIKKMK